MDEITEVGDFRPIAQSQDVPNDFVVPFYVADRKLRVSIARVNGLPYAFGDLCTCTDQACPLSGGLLEASIIMCQCHGSRFDITNGAVVSGPATIDLTVYELREQAGKIQIRL